MNSSQEDLKEYFKYELAPRPPALFPESYMRKGTKSSLVSAFQPEGENFVRPQKCLHVVDGGHLINCVVWPRPGTYCDIMEAYKSYVENHFGKDTVIVFDGYSDIPTTKGETHVLRYRKKAPEVHFNDHTYITYIQCDFLSNVKNKMAIITALATHLSKAGFEIHLATSDADVLITRVALQHAADEKHIIVVGQDTDLLVLLTSLSTTENIWFLRPKAGNKVESVFNISKQQKIHQQVKGVLLFSHAVSGCDTTSSVFRKGKVKSLNLLNNNEILKSKINVFNKANATKEEIVTAGEEFLIALYGKSKHKTLDEQRFYIYHQQTAKHKLPAHFDLATLPPTSAAAAQHSFRVYFQVQQWLGNDLDPCQWGWSLVGNLLKPIPTTLPPAPEKLIHLISCKCKTCCNTCECKRAGLMCSAMCSKCEGRSCENSPDFNIDDTDVVESVF